MNGDVQVPKELLFAWSVIGMFVGDVLSRCGLNAWVPTINMAAGGVLALFMLEPTLWNFVIGMYVGAGATVLHGYRKQAKTEIAKRKGNGNDL